MGKSKKSSLPSLDSSDARQLSLSVWEKAVMKKALNAILFIAAAWALNTGTHSFEEAEGGGTLAKWIHLCEPVNTNSSFEKHRKCTETTRNRLYSLADSFRCNILTPLVNKFVKAAGYIYLASALEEALSSASCDSTSDSLLNHLSKYLPQNKKSPISALLLQHLMLVYWQESDASSCTKRVRFPGYTAWNTTEQRGPVGHGYCSC